mmetsp:Transcript_1135/g.2949  ORF Transcript_1135/g.2949 Transcript_1135/m.2949 type:complete len:303 (+) Transcript_1135:546-1454(+)
MTCSPSRTARPQPSQVPALACQGLRMWLCGHFRASWPACSSSPRLPSNPPSVDSQLPPQPPAGPTPTGSATAFSTSAAAAVAVAPAAAQAACALLHSEVPRERACACVFSARSRACTATSSLRSSCDCWVSQRAPLWMSSPMACTSATTSATTGCAASRSSCACARAASAAFSARGCAASASSCAWDCAASARRADSAWAISSAFWVSRLTASRASSAARWASCAFAGSGGAETSGSAPATVSATSRAPSATSRAPSAALLYAALRSEAARGARSTQPGMRPTPSSWHSALQKFRQLRWRRS